MLQVALQLYKKAYTGIPRPIWWLSFVMFVNRSGTMVIPFLTVYLTHKGYSLTAAGTVMSAFGVGAIVGSYLGGRLADRYGTFRVQVFSLLANGLFFILLSFIDSLAGITAAIFLLACVGEAFRPANSAAIAAHSSDGTRTRAYSLNRLAMNLGWSIGPAIGGILASYDYHLLFWADGLTCLAAAVLLYRSLYRYEVADSPPVITAQTRPAVPASVYRDRTFLQAMGCMLVIGICFFQFFSIIPVFYKEQVQLSEALIGLVLASNGIVIALVEMVLVFQLEGKRPNLHYMILGTLLIGASFLVVALAPYLFGVLAGMMALTFGEMFLFPFTNSFWVSRTNSHNRGRYAALYSMTFALGQVISPALASFLVAGFGFSTLFTLDFFLCALAALGFLWLLKKE